MRLDRFRRTTALLTGGTSGIGFEIARGLAECGARLLLAARNRPKGDAAAASIRAQVPDADIEVLDLDLASLASVRRLCEALRSRGEPIQLCALNAGVALVAAGGREVTEDGFERTFQTNYLGHVALVSGIAPLLHTGSARVVSQVSLAAARGSLDCDNLQGERGYGAFAAYRRSKIALGLWTFELGRHSASHGAGLSVGLAHPGIAPGSGIAPNLRRRFPSPLVHWAERNLGNPPRQAALPMLEALATDDATQRPRMWAPSRWLGIAGPPMARRPFRPFLDRVAAERLWALSEAMLGHPNVRS